MDFTLRQLRAVESVGRHGHFGRAAEELGVSQPTVSAEVRAVESHFGLTLFHRGPGGVSPTVAGERLLPLVTGVLERARALDAVAGQLSAGSCRVRLAASPSLINRLVPRLLSELTGSDPDQTDHPDIQVVEVETGGVLKAVREGTADIGVGHWVTPEEGMKGANLGYDPLHVLTARGLVREDAPVRLRELGAMRLLVWPREQAPDYFDAILDVCHQQGVDPEVTAIESRLSGAHSYLLRDGQAFSLVPRDFAAECPSSLVSAPLEPPAGVPLSAVWRAPGEPGVARLIELLRRFRDSK